MQNFSRYHFQGQRPTEEILEVIHRHWFNILMHFVGILTLGGAILVIFQAFPHFVPGFSGSILEIFANFFEDTVILFLWIYGFMVWVDYYFDVWIITTERVINIEQKGLFIRSVSELAFPRIQDVECHVSGLIPTFLNFGDVEVQTAANDDKFIFRQVPDPYAIKDRIMMRSRDAHETTASRIAEVVEDGV